MALFAGCNDTREVKVAHRRKKETMYNLILLYQL